MAVLLALLYLGGLMLSSKFHVERTVAMQASPDAIYALVANPRQWKRWSAWNQRDPQMTITYDGPESGDGAKWTWKSKSQGDGSMTFVKSEPGKRVGYELYFPDFGTTSTGSLAFQRQGQVTEVRWTMDGDMGSNPLFRWMAFFSDSMVGKDFEEGLANLKALAEKP